MSENKKTRMEPKERAESIIKASIEMAIKDGYRNLKRDAVAEAAGVAYSMVNYVFSDIYTLQNEVLLYAIEHDIVEIVAQGLVNNDPLAKGAPEAVKARAISSLT
jgi:DNA-binding transcriptional regulator YbjK